MSSCFGNHEDEDWSSVYGPQYDVWSYIHLLQHLATMSAIGDDEEKLQALKMVVSFETKNKITRSATIR